MQRIYKKIFEADKCLGILQIVEANTNVKNKC